MNVDPLDGYGFSMLKSLFIAYLCLYSLFMIALFVGHAFFVPPQDKQDERWWETPVDIVMAAVGLLGMIFLLIQYEPAAVKNAWKVVSIALVVGQVYLNLKGRVSSVRAAVAADQPLIRLVDVAAIAFLAPSLFLNLSYAFRSAAESAV